MTKTQVQTTLTTILSLDHFLVPVLCAPANAVHQTTEEEDVQSVNGARVLWTASMSLTAGETSVHTEHSNAGHYMNL